MNFIYFNPDELRADVLGCYGYSLEYTPNIDAFARKSVQFNQCHVQSPVCSPSRCSFMTGLYPHNRGHRSLWHLLQPNEENTLRYLKNNNYEVHVLGQNDLFSKEAIKESVTKVHRIDDGANSENLFHVGEAGYYCRLYKALEDHHNDFYQVKKAVELIKSHKNSDKPFMLFLPLYLPHPPYTVPEPWYSKVSPDNLPNLMPEKSHNAPSYMDGLRTYLGLDTLTQEDFKTLRAVYLGMVSYIDYLFGMILDAVKVSETGEDTAIFFFSDHGDWAGDYGLVEKWPNAMDDALTRVPMIIQSPSCKKGHKVEEIIECFDIMSTTLELATVVPEHTHFSHSLVPMLMGGHGDSTRAAFCEGGFDYPQDEVAFEYLSETKGEKSHALSPKDLDTSHIYYPKMALQRDDPHSVSRTVMIRTLEYKLVYRPKGQSELYDLHSDPHELINLYNSETHTHIQTRLETQLLQWYVETSDTLPWVRDNTKWE